MTDRSISRRNKPRALSERVAPKRIDILIVKGEAIRRHSDPRGGNTNIKRNAIKHDRMKPFMQSRESSVPKGGTVRDIRTQKIWQFSDQERQLVIEATWDICKYQ